ncbi:hypothetical protein [Acetobacter cerevisiae]|uniref:hypothetical protein n=1 Tax=Acetobacter cerevisiae TaxID=178900 RepID=UPI00209F4695|nr:hypothetical protein [Acetobacter cerevisiae]MCP1271973.1 hypothetical protein [Acetobacter cerevisiae]MCP1279927.1 hypothetical protein [Acetobacter cerevisiae]
MTDTNTTLSSLVRSAYPGQYYGQIDSASGVLQMPVLDVWNCISLNGQPISNILALPAAADMVALTSDQVSLLQETPLSGQLIVPVDVTAKTLKYPARYYCDGGTPAAFYDMWGYSSTDHLPDISELHPVASAQWTERQNSAATGLKQYMWNTASGSLETYTPPTVVVPLATKAQSEMSEWISQQASMASAMGETFTDAMKAYVKAIQAIATGTDKTSTALPARPTDIMA